MRVSIVSGYYALGCHLGHLELFKAALEYTKEDDDYGLVYVIVNSDEQTKKKYGFVPISAEKRCRIIEALHPLYETIISVDSDESVAKTINVVESILEPYDAPELMPKITFINSGDRNSATANPKEVEVCNRLGIDVVYLDMPKRGSSSELIKRIKEQGVYELYDELTKRNKEEIEQKYKEWYFNHEC